MDQINAEPRGRLHFAFQIYTEVDPLRNPQNASLRLSDLYRRGSAQKPDEESVIQTCSKVDPRKTLGMLH